MALRAIDARDAKWRQRPVRFRPTSPSFNHAPTSPHLPHSRGRSKHIASMRNLAFALFSLAATCTLFAEDPVKFTVGACEFTRPADWTWVQPTSPMRKAQLQIAGKEGGKPADVTFFFFGSGQGG